MKKRALKYCVAGVAIALATLGLAWLLSTGDALGTGSWRGAALILLGMEIVFLLFIPGNKGGQQFGPHGGPAGSPLVTSGAEFYDRHPARRLDDWRWLFIGMPLVVAAVGVGISFSF